MRYQPGPDMDGYGDHHTGMMTGPMPPMGMGMGPMGIMRNGGPMSGMRGGPPGRFFRRNYRGAMGGRRGMGRGPSRGMGLMRGRPNSRPAPFRSDDEDFNLNNYENNYSGQENGNRTRPPRPNDRRRFNGSRQFSKQRSSQSESKEIKVLFLDLREFSQIII